jgi:hypothetical protein
LAADPGGFAVSGKSGTVGNTVAPAQVLKRRRMIERGWNNSVQRTARPWTASEEKQLRDMRADGKSSHEIGRQLSRTIMAVLTRVRFLKTRKA